MHGWVDNDVLCGDEQNIYYDDTQPLEGCSAQSEGVLAESLSEAEGSCL